MSQQDAGTDYTPLLEATKLWSQGLYLVCNKKRAQVLPGHQATMTAIQVKCLCNQPHDGENVQKDIYEIEPWLDHCGKGLGDDDAPNWNYTDGEIDRHVLTHCKVDAPGTDSHNLTLGEYCRQQAEAVGGPALAGSRVWTYWWNQPHDIDFTSKDAVDRGLAELMALTRQDEPIGVWFVGQVLGYDDETGQFIIIYPSPDATEKEDSESRVWMDLNCVHWGRDCPTKDPRSMKYRPNPVLCPGPDPPPPVQVEAPEEDASEEETSQGSLGAHTADDDDDDDAPQGAAPMEVDAQGNGSGPGQQAGRAAAQAGGQQGKGSGAAAQAGGKPGGGAGAAGQAAKQHAKHAAQSQGKDSGAAEQAGGPQGKGSAAVVQAAAQAGKGSGVGPQVAKPARAPGKAAASAAVPVPVQGGSPPRPRHPADSSSTSSESGNDYTPGADIEQSSDSSSSSATSSSSDSLAITSSSSGGSQSEDVVMVDSNAADTAPLQPVKPTLVAAPRTTTQLPKPPPQQPPPAQKGAQSQATTRPPPPPPLDVIDLPSKVHKPAASTDVAAARASAAAGAKQAGPSAAANGAQRTRAAAPAPLKAQQAEEESGQLKRIRELSGWQPQDSQVQALATLLGRNLPETQQVELDCTRLLTGEPLTAPPDLGPSSTGQTGLTAPVTTRSLVVLPAPPDARVLRGVSAPERVGAVQQVHDALVAAARGQKGVRVSHHRIGAQETDWPYCMHKASGPMTNRPTGAERVLYALCPPAPGQGTQAPPPQQTQPPSDPSNARAALNGRTATATAAQQGFFVTLHPLRRAVVPASAPAANGAVQGGPPTGRPPSSRPPAPATTTNVGAVAVKKLVLAPAGSGPMPRLGSGGLQPDTTTTTTTATQQHATPVTGPPTPREGVQAPASGQPVDAAPAAAQAAQQVAEEAQVQPSHVVDCTCVSVGSLQMDMVGCVAPGAAPGPEQQATGSGGGGAPLPAAGGPPGRVYVRLTWSKPSHLRRPSDLSGSGGAHTSPVCRAVAHALLHAGVLLSCMPGIDSSTAEPAAAYAGRLLRCLQACSAYAAQS